MKKGGIVIGLVGIFLAVLIVAVVHAQGPSGPPALPAGQGGVTASGDTINFQGQLYTDEGIPVAAGWYVMIFSICSTEDCQTVIWFTPPTPIEVDAQGLFSVLLGGSGIGGTLEAQHFIGDRWLRVEVCNTVGSGDCNTGFDILQPYQRITSAGMSIVSSVSIGNILKNAPDTSTAATSGFVLSIENSLDKGIFGKGLSTGVCGVATSSDFASSGVSGSGVRNGVLGVAGSAGSWGTGVFGEAQDTTIWGFGVWGNAEYGQGVVGTAGAEAKTNINYPASGHHGGVVGSVTNSGDVGVFGGNDDTIDGSGVYGWGFVGVYGVWNNSASYAGLFNGDLLTTDDLYVNYTPGTSIYASNLYVSGNKSALVSTAQGLRALYAIESPEVWFEDFGRATLVNGRAVVTFDALFAETVNLQGVYHVFLTPLGNCHGLYIAAMTPTSFEVRELNDGVANISFDYRIVAKRLGYETTRMNSIPEQEWTKSQHAPAPIEIRQMDDQRNPIPSDTGR